MIEDVIGSLCDRSKFNVTDDMDALAKSTIAIFAKRDRRAKFDTIDIFALSQILQEVASLSKFLSAFVICNDQTVSHKERWICYTVGCFAVCANGLAALIHERRIAELENNLDVVPKLFQLVYIFDIVNASDFTSNFPSNVLSKLDHSLLERHPIRIAFPDMSDTVLAKAFKSVASQHPLYFATNHTQIMPPKYLEAAVMIILYGSRPYSSSIHIIDMIRVIALYYHFVACFAYCGDLLRAQAHSLRKVSHDIEQIIQKHYSEGQIGGYEGLCESALDHITRCIFSHARSGDALFSVVIRHLLDTIDELHSHIVSPPCMYRYDYRVDITNRLFRAVEDCVTPGYLEKNIPGHTLTTAQVASSDAALDMRVSTLEGARAFTSAPVPGIQRP